MQLSSFKYNNKPDSSPSIQAYTNKFKLLVDRLRMDKEKWTAGKLKQEYLLNIQATEGSSIMNINTLYVADDTIHYKQTVDKLLKTAIQDEIDQEKQQRRSYQRLPGHSKGDTKRNGSIPSIPGHLLDLMKKGNGLQASGLILKWRNIWNEVKRHIRSDELRLNDNRDSNHIKNKKGNPKGGNRGGGNHKNDNKSNKKTRKQRLSIIAEEPARGTTIQTVKKRKTTAGVPHTTAVVSIKDPDETKYTVFTESSSGDDTNTEEAVCNKDDKQLKPSKSSSTNRKQRRTRKRRIQLRRKRSCSVKAYSQELERLRLIYDTGTAIEVFEKG